MRAALALIFALATSPALAATGEAVFIDKCGDCHTLDPNPAATAPALRGVVGRKIASVPGFSYSDALKAKAGGVWTDASLDAFIAAPKTFAPGTTMVGGAADPADRAAIIDYLKTAK
jgi:cytochrome c